MGTRVRDMQGIRWGWLLGCLILFATCGAEQDSAASTTSQPTTSTTSEVSTTTAEVSTTTAEVSTTTTEVSTTDTSATATTAPPTTILPHELVLRPDGLGDLDFGEPTASTMAVLVGLLGPPSPGEEYPYAGHPLRHVYWEQVGLAVVFSDFEFYRDDGEEHFAGWGHSIYIGDLAGWDHGPSSLPLVTLDGIGIDATLGDLQAAYPDLDLVAECDPGGPPTAAYLRGRVSIMRFSFRDLPLESGSRVSGIGAGASPGC